MTDSSSNFTLAQHIARWASTLTHLGARLVRATISMCAPLHHFGPNDPRYCINKNWLYHQKAINRMLKGVAIMDDKRVTNVIRPPMDNIMDAMGFRPMV